MKETLYLFNSKSGYVNVKVLAKQLFSIIIRKKAKNGFPSTIKTMNFKKPVPVSDCT